MTINTQILNLLQKQQTISTEQALKLGFSRALLPLYAREGLLVQVKQGLYALPDTIQDDLYILFLASRKIIFSHETALFLNGISERIPFKHTLTIPSGHRLSQKTLEECTCYYIKPELHSLGLTHKKTIFGNLVPCYDMERTVCDLIRSQSRCDVETVLSAVKNFAASPDKDLNKLTHYAKQLRVMKKLTPYMEVLL